MTTDIPVSQTSEWTFRRVVWATLVFASVVFCFWLLYRFYAVIFTLFVAIVLGTVIRPITDWLYQRGLPRMAGVIFVYVVIALLVVGFLWLLFPLIFSQGAAITGELPGYYQGVRNWLLQSSNQLFVRFGEVLPLNLPAFTLAKQTGEDVVASAPQVLQYITAVAKIFFGAIVIPVLTLYWTLDGPRIIKSLLLLVPQDRREGMTELVSTIEAKIGLYLIGQTILCLTIGILALIAYLLIGLPNALVLAVIAGVLEAVPMAGPILGAVPASIIAFSISPNRLIWVIVASIVIQQLENSILVPRVMKRTVGVNPFVTLLSIFAFSTFFGVAGALMAIPLAVIVQLILDHFVFKQTVVESDAVEGRNYVSRLRYETQDLIQDLRKQARERKPGSEEEIAQIEHVMDEIETITASLDDLLAHSNHSEDV